MEDGENNSSPSTQQSTIADDFHVGGKLIHPPTVEEVRRHKEKSNDLLAEFDQEQGTIKAVLKEVFIENSSSQENNSQIKHFAQRKQSNQQVSHSKNVIVSVSSILICNYPDCTMELSTEESKMSFHCPQCNGWYCGRHAGDSSMWLLHRNHSLIESSEKFISIRVCQRCFHDHFFPLTDLSDPPNFQNITSIFKHYQGMALAERMQEVNIITERFHKFIKYFNMKEEDEVGKVPLRIFERMVVKWRRDEEVTNCHTCRSLFTALNRKHHCRLCGEIVCAIDLHQTEELGRLTGQLRICSDCSTSLSFAQSVESKKGNSGGSGSTPFGKEFHKLNAECSQARSQLSDILPRFKEQLDQIHYEIYIRPEYEERRLMDARHEAMAARDTIILLFKHYDGLLRRLKELPKNYDIHPDSHIGQICENIFMAGRRYLQQNMLPLKLLPKLDLERIRRGRLLHNQAADQVLNGKNKLEKSSSSLGKFLSSVLSPNNNESPLVPLPANWEALSEKLEVLKEQKGQLEDFIVLAAQEQRYDDLRSLRSSLEEINREVYRLNRVFSTLDLSKYTCE